MNIGILSVQGAVSEHEISMKRAFLRRGIEGKVIKVKRADSLREVDGLIIPGGESSTISRLLDRFELRENLLERADEGMNIMGTCAGAILLAKEGDHSVGRTDTELLGLMDMSVVRNSFGRQRESFERHLEVSGIARDFPGVFIRAPSITRVWGDCRALSSVEGIVVAAQEGNYLALSFHPELTGDTRIHEYFLDRTKSSILHRPSKNC